MAGACQAVTFRTLPRTGLPASSSPFRVVDEQERELEWINRFLDALCVRGTAPLTLRSYANQLLHFVRWWSRQPGVDVTGPALAQFTESTLIDYVRDQVNEVPKPSPENINQRAGLLRRLYRFHFQQDMPHAPYLIQRNWYRRSPLGYGRRIAASSADLKVKVPHRVVTPLSREQVHRFWHSFRTARDLAMVALMLLNGLRSREVLELQLEDVWFSEAQLRVRGKGRRVRLLPLPPETMGLLRCYLKTERPLTNAPEVFVALKGRARGRALKPAGLRSLFRHHRLISGVQPANPHRFRHTFGADMIRAGVSLPALQRLMGHAHIHTTLLYIQMAPQDVFVEYARAVERMTALPQPRLP
jgi:integrase/recombinase XerD